jgi:ribosomal protein L32E
MDEIRVPQHVVDRFERRWTTRFTQMLEDWRRPEGRSPVSICDDPLRRRRSGVWWMDS